MGVVSGIVMSYQFGTNWAVFSDKAGPVVGPLMEYEGLSVVAISYHAVSLASYLLYPLEAPTGLSKGFLTALVTVPVVVLVWAAVRRLRRGLE